MKNQNLNVPKKIMVSIVAILFTLILFGTGTYAWFTITEFNQVDQFVMNIYTGYEFDLSLDNENWYENLDGDLLRDHIEALGDDLELDAVTTLDGKTFVKDVLENSRNAIANHDYIEFVLYFKAVNPPTVILQGGNQLGIYLYNYNGNVLYEDESTYGGTYCASQGVYYAIDTNYIGKNGNSIEASSTRNKYYAEDAIRLSFADNINTDSQVRVFDLGKEERQGDEYLGQYNGALSFVRLRSKDTNTNDVVVDTEYKFLKGSELLSSSQVDPRGIALTNDSLICTLSKDEVLSTDEAAVFTGQVTIRMWLEGWDSDCFNAVTDDNIIAGLEFKMAGLYLGD